MKRLALFLLLSACGDLNPPETIDTSDPYALGSSDTDAAWDPDERLAGCGDPIEGLRGRIDCGAWLYEDHCAICHGAFGTGSGIGVDLTAALPRLSDAQIITAMAQGKGADMPAIVVPPPGYGHVLTYVRQTFDD
jgi:mono/diheme cytochrome c family protein